MGVTRRRPRDSQRKRVYNWETKFVDPYDRIAKQAKTLTLAECREIVARAYDGRLASAWRGSRERADVLYPGPEVKDGRGRRRGSGSARRINLPVWTRYPAYVLHECAHGLIAVNVAHHGPEFVAKFIELLVTVEGHDLSYLLRTARSSGVKIAERS